MTTTTDDHTVAPNTGSVSRLERFKQLAERLREPPKPVEIPPPITTESIRKKVDAISPGYMERWKARREAQREVDRPRIHPEFVPYDDEWKSLVAAYKAAHPSRNPRLSADEYHFYLNSAASEAESTGDARDLGLWFRTLREWQAEKDKPKQEEAPQTTDPTDLTTPGERLLARLRSHSSSGSAQVSMRAEIPCPVSKEKSEPSKIPVSTKRRQPVPDLGWGKKRQKRVRQIRRANLRKGIPGRDAANKRRHEAAQRRKKLARDEQIQTVMAAGGIYSCDTDYLLTARGVQVKADQCRLLAQRRADWNHFWERPAASALPLPESGFRSKAEESIADLIRGQLLPDVSLRYVETQCRGYSDDLSTTWAGYRTYTTRDFDLDIGKSAYQIQVKGSDFYYHRLKESLEDKSEYWRRRQFVYLRAELLNFIVRGSVNLLVTNYSSEFVRPTFYVSKRSIALWEKELGPLADSKSLRKLLRKESDRMWSYFTRFIRAIFPEESEVLDHAVDLFLLSHASISQEAEISKWCTGAIVNLFQRSLLRAKIELDYDDSEQAARRQWKSLKFYEIKKRLPRRFLAKNPEIRHHPVNPEQLAIQIGSFYETFARVDVTTLGPADFKEYTWAMERG
jgi:hypothetical protein